MTASSMEELVSLCKRRGFIFNLMIFMEELKVCMIMGPWVLS